MPATFVGAIVSYGAHRQIDRTNDNIPGNCSVGEVVSARDDRVEPGSRKRSTAADVKHDRTLASALCW